MTPGLDGETRSERNERFNKEVPEWSVPEAGQYLWDWFAELCTGINRVADNGRVVRITWLDIDAWLRVTRHLVNPSEISVLKSMDNAYCEALEGEVTYARERAAERAGQGRK